MALVLQKKKKRENGSDADKWRGHSVLHCFYTILQGLLGMLDSKSTGLVNT
jgi:hypothetical protein